MSALQQAVRAIRPSIVHSDANPYVPFGSSRFAPGYWKDFEHHKEFFKWTELQLNITRPEDWYQYGKRQIFQCGGAGMLCQYYNDSLYRALCAVYEQEEWLPWRFSQCPKGFWDSELNQQWYISWLAKELVIEYPEQWYNVTTSLIQSKGTLELLYNYGKSVRRVLEALYPEYDWQSWRFSGSKALWTSISNQRKFFQHIAVQLNIKDTEGWYSVKQEDVIKLGGKFITKYRRPSLGMALKASYPNIHWHIWKFEDVKRVTPRSHDHRTYLDWYAKLHGMVVPEGWYSVDLYKILGEDSMLEHITSKYRYCLVSALLDLYPEINWQVWKFQKVPTKFWKKTDHRLDFIQYLAAEKGITHLEGWYAVKDKHFVKSCKAVGLKPYYSVASALTTLYPEVHWLNWEFDSPARGFWLSSRNQKQYISWLAIKLDIKSPEDWYNITPADFKKYNGSGLLNLSSFSLHKLLAATYPDVEWQGWRFENAPRGFWLKESNVAAYVKWLSNELGIVTPEDWYYVSLAEMKKLKGNRLLKLRGGLQRVIEKYCGVKLDNFSFRKKSERTLLRLLKKLFPNTTVLTNFKHPHLQYADSQRNMELDIYIPELSAAFEYQGIQHFRWKNNRGPPEKQRKRDDEKRIACDQYGITLVQVPHWWDITESSLIATIQQQCPRILAKEYQVKEQEHSKETTVQLDVFDMERRRR